MTTGYKKYIDKRKPDGKLTNVEYGKRYCVSQ